MLVYRRNTDAEFFGGFSIRATFAIAHSDDGGCLMRQVVVDAIHGGLPSFLQSAGFLQSDRLLIRKWEKLDEPLVPLFLGDDVEASVLHTSHQIGGSGLFPQERFF